MEDVGGQRSHEAWTIAPFGGAYRDTHASAEALRVWVAPLRLDRPLHLKRLSAVVLSANGTTVDYGLGLYRAIRPHESDHESPPKGPGSAGLHLELVAPAGRLRHALAEGARMNADFPPRRDAGWPN